MFALHSAGEYRRLVQDNTLQAGNYKGVCGKMN
jgi:hypothetical protein